MKRRALAMRYDNVRRIWFGRPAPELTKEYIIETLLKDRHTFAALFYCYIRQKKTSKL